MEYDLVVIGGGPAGEKGAVEAAYFGKKVALIQESKTLGGKVLSTALLVKSLREPSLVIHSVRQHNIHGIQLQFDQPQQIDMLQIIERAEKIESYLESIIRESMINSGIDTFTGHASFIDDKTVELQEENGKFSKIRAKVCLIATGSKEFIPDWFPIESPRAYSAGKIRMMKKIPQEMTIIGSGPIGCEYASIFSALGTKVHIISSTENLLNSVDHEISSFLKEQMQKDGIQILSPEKVIGCTPLENKLKLFFESGKTFETENVMIAIGSKSHTKEMNLEKLGIQTDSKGYITVNEQYQTSVPSIYAAGDVIGFPGLASTSMEQARFAVLHAFGLGYKDIAPCNFPIGIYTIPEIGMAGKTEEQLKAQNIDYIVGRCGYCDIPRGFLIQEKGGFLKLLFRKEDMELLGAHIIGESATELIHLAEIAMITKAKGNLFINACFNFPTLHELYKYATYDALVNQALKKGGKKNKVCRFTI